LKNQADHDTIQTGGADCPYIPDIEAQIAFAPGEAFGLEMRIVPLPESPGEVCAAMVSAYPPGVPLLVPGERIQPAHAERIAGWQAAGLSVIGLSPGGIRVVK